MSVSHCDMQLRIMGYLCSFLFKQSVPILFTLKCCSLLPKVPSSKLFNIARSFLLIFWSQMYSWFSKNKIIGLKGSRWWLTCVGLFLHGTGNGFWPGAPDTACWHFFVPFSVCDNLGLYPLHSHSCTSCSKHLFFPEPSAVPFLCCFIAFPFPFVDVQDLQDLWCSYI